jgi:hypothetical protein
MPPLLENARKVTLTATYQQFNRRWLQESARQGWSREDVKNLLASLDPGDTVLDLDKSSAVIISGDGSYSRPYWRTRPVGQAERRLQRPKFWW